MVLLFVMLRFVTREVVVLSGVVARFAVAFFFTIGLRVVFVLLDFFIPVALLPDFFDEVFLSSLFLGEDFLVLSVVLRLFLGRLEREPVGDFR
jgi:hypothetical protein